MKEFLASLISSYFLISVIILRAMLPMKDLEFPQDLRKQLVKLTTLTSFSLTTTFAIGNYIRRYFTFNRPLKEIEEALEQIKNGNFNIKLQERPEARYGQLDGIIRDINLMAKELGGIETLRNDFAANISHELKAPLAVLMNYGTLLQIPGLPEEKRLEYAKGITEETRRMSSLITSILKLNRLENQQIYPNTQVYDVSEQVIECLLDFESVWERKQIEIVNEIEEDIQINADPELLSPVWENLFSNAMKYTDEGGRVTVKLWKEKSKIIFSVSDTGIGMSEKTQAHIFDKFYQGDLSRASEGNGLGLSLVQRILSILEGTISVESAEGAGSTFTVTLPTNIF